MHAALHVTAVPKIARNIWSATSETELQRPHHEYDNNKFHCQLRPPQGIDNDFEVGTRQGH